MRNLRCDLRGVLEGRSQRLAKEFADPILALVQRSNTLAYVGDCGGCFKRWKTWRLAWTVLERRGVECQNLRFARCRFHALVEALANLLADHFSFDHLFAHPGKPDT